MADRNDADHDVAAVTYDHDDESVVVIIGSGAGGGTLADELTAKGIDCVLLEAGPRIENTEFENDEHWANETLLWPNDREGTGTRALGRHIDVDGARGRRLHDVIVVANRPAFSAPRVQDAQHLRRDRRCEPARLADQL